ncbi:MAG: hypothetical protein ACREYE_09535 [Gammaproteobacteria bacterium]
MNDELTVTPRTREELIARWQQKYGYSKEKAKTRAWPVFLAMAGARVRNNGKTTPQRCFFEKTMTSARLGKRYKRNAD